MISSRRFALAAALVGGLAVGAATPAHAMVTLTLHETGFADVVVTGATAASFSGTFGDFVLTLDTGTSAGSTPGEALLLTTTNSVRNTATGPKTLTVDVVQNSYTTPFATTMVLDSSLSSTQITAGGSLAFTSSLNATLSPTVMLTAPGFVAAASTLVAVAGTPYSLDNTTVITLDTGGSANSTGTTSATAPEPSTIVLALTALPLLGYWVRRRKTA